MNKLMNPERELSYKCFGGLVSYESWSLLPYED